MSESHSKSPHVGKFIGRTTGHGATPAQVLFRHSGAKSHFKTGGLVPVVGQAKDTPAHPGKGYAQGGQSRKGYDFGGAVKQFLNSGSPPGYQQGGLTPAARVPVNTEQQMMRKGGHRCRSAGGQMNMESRLKAEGRRSGESEMTKEDSLRRAMGGAAKQRKGFPNT